MPTVINNPGSHDTSGDSGLGIILGVIVAILLIMVFVVYGIPALRGNTVQDAVRDTNINVTVPDVQVPGSGTGTGGGSGGSGTGPGSGGETINP